MCLCYYTYEEKSAKDYMEGKMTMTEAARKASLTVWEMEKYLICQEFSILEHNKN